MTLCPNHGYDTSSPMNQVDQHIQADNAAWSFGGHVPEYFQGHVEKSVPLYQEGHDLILKLADFFIPDQGVCYDLGCSTGELISKLASRFKNKNIQMIGIDCEQAMIDHAKENHPNLDFICEDILASKLEKSHLIIAYYTVQFIHPERRQEFFHKIYDALHWGGALILFEKVRAPDARFQDMTSSLYTDYKLDQGYSAEQIIAKAKSLKGVLEPFSTQGNLDLMKRAGFTDIMSIMKYICFEGFVAIK